MVQQLRKSITALALFVLCAAAGAQAPSTPLTIRPDAPDRYVVVPGDTLWGISQRYTDSPWRWPELWGLNKDQIRNPHLIYPGYVHYARSRAGATQHRYGHRRRDGYGNRPGNGAGRCGCPVRVTKARPSSPQPVSRQGKHPEHSVFGYRAVSLASPGGRARWPGQSADHRRHAGRSRHPRGWQQRLRTRYRRLEGRELVRLPARRAAGRSGHEPDARVRGDLPRHARDWNATAIRPRSC